MRGASGCWGRGRCGPPSSLTCQTDLDAGAVPARPGVRHLPPTIGQPRIQRRRPPARPGPAPPPPQGYGSGLGSGVRAGTQTPRPRRPGGGRMVEPGDRRSTRHPRPSLAPSAAQSGAAASAASAASTTTSEPDTRRPRRFRRHLPEPRALPPPCRPGPARARAVRPRACVRARSRGAGRAERLRRSPSCGRAVSRVCGPASRSFQAEGHLAGIQEESGTPRPEASGTGRGRAETRSLVTSARAPRGGRDGLPWSSPRSQKERICGCGR